MITKHTFSGIWRSSYWFPSNTHEGEDVSEYIVKIHQHGDKLTATSVPRATGDHITVNLTVDGRLATGTWFENTSPEGEFVGMDYSGALQLLISEDGNYMDGQWVGVGREKQDDGSFEPQIYHGRWELVRMKESSILHEDNVEDLNIYDDDTDQDNEHKHEHQ